jgi:molybdate-binding protein
MNSFSEFVRNTRLDLNIGLREFATKLDLSSAFISNPKYYIEILRKNGA